MRQAFALKRWAGRLRKTKEFTSRKVLLIAKMNKRKKRACFNGLRDHFRVVNDLVKSLGNLEKMMRDKIVSDSFKTIKTFS